MSRPVDFWIQRIFPLDLPGNDPGRKTEPRSRWADYEAEPRNHAGRASHSGVATRRQPDAPPPPDDHPDLISRLNELLIERARLDAEIEKIKTAAPKDDEFGRFAKQAVHFVDALDRILRLGRVHAQSDEVAAWLKSVESAYERLQRLLERHEFIIVDSMGQEVDLAHHEVMEYRKTKEAPHNTVIDELQKGIKFRGRMIRDARVVVACNE